MMNDKNHILKMYLIRTRVSSYLVNAYSAQNAMYFVLMRELDAYNTPGHDYVVKQINSTKEGIVLNESLY